MMDARRAIAVARLAQLLKGATHARCRQHGPIGLVDVARHLDCHGGVETFEVTAVVTQKDA